MKNKKGFTLIELIVVIAVLGILVLLATPKFIGYVEDAKVAQIKNDVKAYESAYTVLKLEDEVSNYMDYSNSKMYEVHFKKNYDNELKNRQGQDNFWTLDGLYNEEFDLNQNYYVLNESYFITQEKGVKSKLDGTFFIDEKGIVYYSKDKLRYDTPPA